MANINSSNVQTGNFTTTGNWNFGGSLTFPALSTATTSEIVYVNGSGVLTKGGAPGGVQKVTTVTSSTSGVNNFPVTSDLVAMEIMLWGAGGQGGGASNGVPTDWAAGGGGGGFLWVMITGALLQTITSVTANLGAGGQGGAGVGGNGASSTLVINNPNPTTAFTLSGGAGGGFPNIGGVGGGVTTNNALLVSSIIAQQAGQRGEAGSSFAAYTIGGKGGESWGWSTQTPRPTSGNETVQGENLSPGGPVGGMGGAKYGNTGPWGYGSVGGNAQVIVKLYSKLAT